MKRISIAVLVLLILMSLFAGCSKPEASTSTTTGSAKTVADKETTLRVAWWGNQTRNDLTVQALNLYSENNKNIKIVTEFTGWDSYWDKLAAQAAAGTMPDIFQQDNFYIKMYHDKNLMENLNPYVENKSLNVGNISDSVLTGGSINGNLYAVSLGINANSLCYDKDITDSAGVTIGEHMTWDEFVNVSKTIYEKTKVQTQLGYGDGESFLQYVALSQGYALYSEDGKKMGFPNASIPARYFKLFEDGVRDGWYISPEIYTERSASGVEQDPIIDKIAWNTFKGSNLIVALNKSGGKNYPMVLMPYFEDDKFKGEYVTSSMYFSISPSSGVKEESAKLIDYFVNSVECNNILNAERGVPPSSEIAAALGKTQTEDVKKVFDFVALVQETAFVPNLLSPAGAGEIARLLYVYNDSYNLYN